MSIKDSIKELNRLRQIIDILFKEGFGFLIYKTGLRNLLALNLRLNKKKYENPKDSAPVRLRRIMEELDGTFIKLGQLLSLRPDLIPKEYAKEFSKLQDHVPPIEAEAIGIFSNFKKTSFSLDFNSDSIVCSTSSYEKGGT